ncbi:exocyst subunit exo70 family protein F1 [Actinidia rufa]|uniref:Exocyst subunit Exo70 family protein n=1 Tax=Actinidia rufa TaxID=165716 RepID=A0A7J0H3X3_9ERIC|nr:exocyst subunit exo70 family protein F1 [Actinidia rufa]
MAATIEEEDKLDLGRRSAIAKASSSTTTPTAAIAIRRRRRRRRSAGRRREGDSAVGVGAGVVVAAVGRVAERGGGVPRRRGRAPEADGGLVGRGRYRGSGSRRDRDPAGDVEARGRVPPYSDSEHCAARCRSALRLDPEGFSLLRFARWGNRGLRELWRGNRGNRGLLSRERAKYEKECCQVYSSVRRDVIDECLSILGVEKLSIEEVQRIEWRSLDDKMKKWVQSVKVGVRVLLVGEKRLCDHLFEDSELIQEVCFVETAKGCVMQLLNFGEAVAIGRRSSEKLFRILDMYDVLANVFPDLEELFGGESGKAVCSEARGVMDRLGLAAIGTFVEFENAVQGEASRKPIQGGDIHPLTRYVMNYVKLLVDYSDSLNALLENSVDESGDSQRDDGDLPAECKSLFAQRLLSLIKSLESNLEEKSRMYEDGAMQYVFLMNNILYIVQKVKDSELGKLLGDQWVRKRRGQIRQYSTSYLRASWTKVLSCLKDEGIGGSTSNASKVALKERFKNFNACFEEIYRIQTAWKVPDAQLREELRISISEKVIPAYRSFMGRFGNHLESGRHAGKYIKYTPDDLENYLSDLFEGTPGVLNLTRRKST